MKNETSQGYVRICNITAPLKSLHHPSISHKRSAAKIQKLLCHHKKMTRYCSSSLLLLLVLFVVPFLVMTEEIKEDIHAKCEEWGEQNECKNNANYMKQNCAATCSRIESNCRYWAEQGECDNNARYMLTSCEEECKMVKAQKEEEEHDDESFKNSYGISIGHDGLPFDMEAVKQRMEAANEHSSCFSNDDEETSPSCVWPPGIVRLPENYPAKATLAPPKNTIGSNNETARQTTLSDLHRSGLFPTVQYMKPESFSRSLVGSAVAVKIINFTGRRLKKMWDDGSEEGVFNGYLSGGLGDRSTLMTYDGHTFAFVDATSGELYKKVTMRYDVHYIVFQPDPIDESTLQLEAYKEAKREERFMAQYYKQNGQPWLARYGRPPPVLNTWPANYVGQTHTIETNHSHWMCDDLNNNHDATKCQSSSPLTVNLTVVSHAGIDGPRVFVIPDLMSDAECDHILRLGKEVIRDSEVGNAGSGFKSNSRTSMTGWLSRTKSPILETMQKRFADVLGLDERKLTSKELVEELQVVRYQHGQRYDPHHDFADGGGPGYGQRFLTLLLYVVVPEEGGHTSFPKAYGGRGMIVKPPKRGGAVLFYSMLPDGNGDDLSLHAGQPVEGGHEKWVCNLWVWDPSRQA